VYEFRLYLANAKIFSKLEKSETLSLSKPQTLVTFFLLKSFPVAAM